MKVRDLLLERKASSALLKSVTEKELEKMSMMELATKYAAGADSLLMSQLNKEAKKGAGDLFDYVGATKGDDKEELESKLYKKVKEVSGVGRMSPLDEKYRPYHIEIIKLYKKFA
jgi:hypothetical protein